MPENFRPTPLISTFFLARSWGMPMVGRVRLDLAQLGLAEFALGVVLGGLLARLFVKAFGTVEAGHDLPRLLFLEAAFAGVAVDQISLLAQGRPLGRGGVVGLVLDHVLLARVDADRLGLDTRALGPLRLGAGAERAAAGP